MAEEPLLTLRVPFFELAAIHEPLQREILEALERVVCSQRYILGEDVAALETEIVSYLGGNGHAVACASGSDALLLALLAAGIGPGDAVLTTPFTFFATAGAISRTGAVPVFADIDPLTYNLRPDSAAAAMLHRPVKAIIPVHLYGGCADMDPLIGLARRHGAVVVEDGAQALGAAYKGRAALTLADFGCLSFFPTKNLGALGDAGMVTAARAEDARTLASLRVHGSHTRYEHTLLGINSRMDSLQAAVLRLKLAHLEKWTEARRDNAAVYFEHLAGIPVGMPIPAVYQSRHVYHQFVIRSAERDELRKFLAGRGIGTEVYYPIPLHLQECYAHLGHKQGDYPESERAAREVLALPVHPGVTMEQIGLICQIIREFHSR